MDKQKKDELLKKHHEAYHQNKAQTSIPPKKLNWGQI
jgi:hypothetical protein